MPKYDKKGQESRCRKSGENGVKSRKTKELQDNDKSIVYMLGHYRGQMLGILINTGFKERLRLYLHRLYTLLKPSR